MDALVSKCASLVVSDVRPQLSFLHVFGAPQNSKQHGEDVELQ